MVKYIRSDLDFILQQILISEAHAAGGDLTTLVSDPTLPFGMRTVDGTLNNLIPGQENFGAADTLFPRITPANFRIETDNESFDVNGPGPGGLVTNNDYGAAGNVVDSDPRTISNLIVDQTANNPAALAAWDGVAISDNGTLIIPNIAADEGLSAPFNSWMTLFGQFFDHGLDLLTKGDNGTVYVPLQPDDPLYVEGGHANFMVLTRATLTGTEHENTTTSFVDQNQTYTSISSHQVFLREYEIGLDGKPVATGKMLEGASGGIANWAEVKAQALSMLGIELDNLDVLNVPLLATDQYGKFIPDPLTGFAQIVTDAGPPPVLQSGTPLAPVDASTALKTNHAFLNDIAHTAAPTGRTGPLTADTDLTAGDHFNQLGEDGLPMAGGSAFYDDELLDRHFITGDGRGNENIGLTTVHHVFHSEHNRLVEHTKDVILATGDDAFIAQWQLPDGSWNGERLFQAAKFGTEMQYQHLVFEEFGRKVQPLINIFSGYEVDIDPSIVSEFANVVYRFGHSMLTETVARLNDDGTSNDIGLIEAFLNPIEFDQNGAVSADVAAGAIVRGMTRQVGNEIDEFVTEALRNNLLGLPLDLATINMARARDTGVPTLNAARRDFYEKTGSDPTLKPYDSWLEFAQSIKNPTSVMNFIAAYGTHDSLNTIVDSVSGLPRDTNLAEKRAAAAAIITGQPQVIEDASNPPATITFNPPTDSTDFLLGQGAWDTLPGAVTTTGLDSIDLWIGGLAEKKDPFGGFLGSTFNFVFEQQMEALQNGDRFYYLGRLAGTHFLTELEGNSFAALIERNTDLGTDGMHLPGDIFSTPAYILEVDQLKQVTGLGLAGNGDPTHEPTGNPIVDAINNLYNPLVQRNNPATALPDTNYLQYVGVDHVVLGGTDGNDILISSIGDDTLWGDDGNDRLEGGAGVDQLIGGDGDDILTDVNGDDNIKGGAGNDVVNSGDGFDLILLGDGNDFSIGGADANETFGGEGNDFIYGGDDADVVFGDGGHDWIEGGTQADLLQGDFGAPFQDSTTVGNDVIIGGGGNDDYDSESGDDIMVAGVGTERMEGMLGFDWATYVRSPAAADADFFFTGLLPPDIEAIRDRFDLVEGLSGSDLNDTLRGDNSTTVELAAIDATSGQNNALNSGVQINLINGLQGILGAGVTSFSAGNIILGGDGSDIMEGRGGDDILDGDAWLNVRIGVDGRPELNNVTSMLQIQAELFLGTINPGQLNIVREILTADGTGDVDRAVFSDVFANYTLTENGDGTWSVTHDVLTPGIPARVLDGTDTLRNMERAVFADRVFNLVNVAPAGVITISDLTPTETQTLTATPAFADPDGISGPVTYTWQASNNGGATFTNVGTGLSFTPLQAQVGQILRVVATYTDDLLTPETVVSAVTDIVGDFINDGAGGNTLNGNAGADLINGNGGADTINGNAGGDVLNGGAGNDIINGGTGEDTLNGGADNDTLNGGADNDTLNGDAGNDTLNGGAGADAMTGGLGNDIYVVDNAGDTVNELAGAGSGTDTIQTTFNTFSLAALANVENLTFTGTGDFVGTGNGANNAIIGGAGDDVLDGGVGVDTLTGGGGNDVLIGGLGVDIMVGGAGDDVYFVNSAGETVTEAAGAAGGIDTVFTTTIAFVAAANVENVHFTGSTTTTLIGNALANVLTGGALNDVILGLNGADTIVGGTGDDFLVGGVGTDTFGFAAGFGNDRIVDFDANVAGGQDLLDVTGLGITAGDFAARVSIVDLGTFTQVVIDGTETITLNGVNGVGANLITSADFLLA